jgi:hypothetical protein
MLDLTKSGYDGATALGIMALGIMETIATFSATTPRIIGLSMTQGTKTLSILQC